MTDKETKSNNDTAETVVGQRPSDALELLHHVENLITLGESRANIIAAGNAALLVGYNSTELFNHVFPPLSKFWQNWPSVFAMIAIATAIISLVPQKESTRWADVSRESYFFRTYWQFI